LQWIPELDTGIPEIDKQHRRICDYINLLDQIRRTHDRQKLGEVIEEMVDYTVSHFSFEETLMEDAGYLLAGPHKRVHELVTRRVGEFKTRYEAGEDVTEELHNMLSRWLFNHIRNEDHGYMDTVTTYLRMTASAQHAKIEAASQAVSQPKRGWIARLFGAR
jgi:hemerythrin